MWSFIAALTTLSSAANHLVTVYDVNYASSGHLEVHGVPSLLPGSSELDLPILGTLCFQPLGEESSNYSHFQLSSRGSLWKTNVSFPSEVVKQASHKIPNDFEWADEMHELAEKGKTMAEDIGSLGEREHIVANLRGIYESQRLLSSDRAIVAYSSFLAEIYDVKHDASHVTEENAEAVYQTLEKMPFFWQDMNGTVEHMLTA
jgi:hypothetical protein